MYIPGGDVIVAPGQGFVRIEQYYADHFAISAGQEYESWRAQVLLGEGKSIHADWQTGREMQFVMPLGNAVTGGKPGKVVYRISLCLNLALWSASSLPTFPTARISARW